MNILFRTQAPSYSHSWKKSKDNSSIWSSNSLSYLSISVGWSDWLSSIFIQISLISQTTGQIAMIFSIHIHGPQTKTCIFCHIYFTANIRSNIFLTSFGLDNKIQIEFASGIHDPDDLIHPFLSSAIIMPALNMIWFAVMTVKFSDHIHAAKQLNLFIILSWTKIQKIPGTSFCWSQLGHIYENCFIHHWGRNTLETNKF